MDEKITIWVFTENNSNKSIIPLLYPILNKLGKNCLVFGLNHQKNKAPVVVQETMTASAKLSLQLNPMIVIFRDDHIITDKQIQMIMDLHNAPDTIIHYGAFHRGNTKVKQDKYEFNKQQLAFSLQGLNYHRVMPHNDINETLNQLLSIKDTQKFKDTLYYFMEKITGYTVINICSEIMHLLSNGDDQWKNILYDALDQLSDQGYDEQYEAHLLQVTQQMDANAVWKAFNEFCKSVISQK